MLGEVLVTNVKQRMDILRKRYGQRFTEMPLHNFVRGKQQVPDSVELLVLRSGEIDSQLESNPETTLGLIHDTLKRLRVAVHKLKQQGFHDVVIATDHGFFLNAQAEAGDVCVEPQGNWLNAHERSLLGDGVADSHSFVVPAERVGIRGILPNLPDRAPWLHIALVCCTSTAERLCKKPWCLYSQRV